MTIGLHSLAAVLFLVQSSKHRSVVVFFEKCIIGIILRHNRILFHPRKGKFFGFVFFGVFFGKLGTHIQKAAGTAMPEAAHIFSLKLIFLIVHFAVLGIGCTNILFSGCLLFVVLFGLFSLLKF
jgi:hypothetical protein